MVRMQAHPRLPFFAHCSTQIRRARFFREQLTLLPFLLPLFLPHFLSPFSPQGERK